MLILWVVCQNADMVKQLTSTQQAQEELVTAKQQIAEELKQIKQENSTKVKLPVS